MASIETEDQAWIFSIAIINVICGIIILLSFKICKEWRVQFEKRFLLFMLTLHVIFFSLAYVIFIQVKPNSIQCILQASMVQFFAICMMMNKAMISNELFEDILSNMSACAGFSGYCRSNKRRDCSVT